MTTATRKQKAKPYSQFHRTTQQVAARIAKHATGGLTVRTLYAGTERVSATIGRHSIEATIQRGELISSYTCLSHLEPDATTDYFPGHHWPSLAQAIACCLPDERASCRGLPGIDAEHSSLTVNIHREGVALKPVAYIELYSLSHPRRYGSCRVRKIKSGTLLHLCQEFVRTAGEDRATVMALLDHLEELGGEAADYLRQARG